MEPVAWMVLGEPHYREAFTDEARAHQIAALHQGIVKALVYEESANDLLASVALAALAVPSLLPVEKGK